MVDRAAIIAASIIAAAVLAFGLAWAGYVPVGDPTGSHGAADSPAGESAGGRPNSTIETVYVEPAREPRVVRVVRKTSSFTDDGATSTHEGRTSGGFRFDGEDEHEDEREHEDEDGD